MNRKATFAKRQREADLKEHARAKEARKAARKDTSRTGKGPEIAWDEAVYPATESAPEGAVTASPPTDAGASADPADPAAPVATSPISLVPTDDSP